MAAKNFARYFGLFTGVFLALSGCSVLPGPSFTTEDTQPQSGSNLPYNPLVYHMDLSIFAYQLYGQTLAWPFDPFYEETDTESGNRKTFMDKVRAWSAKKGADQIRDSPRLGGYRGPGVLGGFDNNTSHDPIVYRYDRRYPWSNTIAHSGGNWVEYLTPKKITGEIRDVFMCYRNTGQQEGAVAVERVTSGRGKPAVGARNVVLAFEGGTGDKGEAGQPPSQSLMGFALLRYNKGLDSYDLHIAFRGSRSGSVFRAAKQALSDGEATGNPDWITDLGYNHIGPNTGASHISTVGTVSRGFATSMKSILPQLFACLGKAAKIVSNSSPENIYVTGHSLGGALAKHFVSAILLGDRYGPDGTGSAMPAALKAWPWGNIKLITFSAPRAGNAKWAKTLTVDTLESVFFSTSLVPIDRTSLAVSDPNILLRLSDQTKPAGYRVLISSDPITTEKVVGGKHVGKTVYVNKLGVLSSFTMPSADAHEPMIIRNFMLGTLQDSTIPATAWRYWKMKDMNPEYDKARRASVEETEKFGAAILRYYRTNKQLFGHAEFAQDLRIYQELQ